MVRVGFFTPSATSHLNSAIEVALEVQRRGHHVIFFGFKEMQNKVSNLGFEFLEVGHDLAENYTSVRLAEIGELDGLAAVNTTIDYIAEMQAVYHRDAPDLVRSAQLDLMFIDQVLYFMATVAKHVQVPYVVFCVALNVVLDPLVPPIFSHRIPSDSLIYRLRNFIDNRLQAFMTRKLVSAHRDQHAEWNIPYDEDARRAESALATIIQLPKSIDFPRQTDPNYYHYIGRIADPSGVEPLSANITFPFEKLDGRPLVYASLGTIQNRIASMFQKIIEACNHEDINAQLVLSLGDRDASVDQVSTDTSAIVVPFAPQEKLVSMAALVITHGGCSTTTMALSYGVPMVVIPIANDQPGIGARVVKAGLGLVIHPRNLTVDALRSSILEVLGDKTYAERCALISKEIEEAGGVERTADIVEEVARTKMPVLKGGERE